VAGFTATATYDNGQQLDVTRTSSWDNQDSPNTNSENLGSDEPYPDQGLFNVGDSQGTILITASNDSDGRTSNTDFWTGTDSPVQNSTLITVVGGAVFDIYVEVYRTDVGAGGNCYNVSSSVPGQGMLGPLDGGGAIEEPDPTTGWGFDAWHPKGGYTTWVRALGKSGEADPITGNYEWSDISSLVTWTVIDPSDTGTTLDATTGRVTTGAGANDPLEDDDWVYFVATLDGVSSDPTGLTQATPSGRLKITSDPLTNLKINPEDVTTTIPPQADFGPDPIYVAVGNSSVAKVTGAFTDVDNITDGYCITWDAALSSNKTNVATVDASGTVVGVAAGTATVTARKGTTISDTIPVNVGAPEVLYLEMSPTQVSMTTDANASAQLHVIAHFTNGTTLDVFNDTTHTFYDSDEDDIIITISDTGLVKPIVGTTGAGDVATVWACYDSTYVSTSGVSDTFTLCSDQTVGDQDSEVQSIDPATGGFYQLVTTVTFH
jgi:hypothetical protein